MATNKAKRSIHLAQPQRRSPNRRNLNRRNPNNDPAVLTPVKPHVYYSIAELNAGLEKAIQNLTTLQSNQLFGASGLAEMNRLLRGIRARANRHLTTAINQRETANAGHFPENR